MLKHWSVLVLVSSLVLGCQEPTANYQTIIGTIDAGTTLPDVIQGPISGSIGQRLEFTVSTFGNSCITAKGAEVVVNGLLATVTPYDREYQGPLQCLDYMKAYPRTVVVVFANAGSATVRVQGQSDYHSGLVSVDHAVNISP